MITIAVGATLGYVFIEGYGWLDAVYMTVITLGTVGYGEVQPLDTVGRVFTMGVIIVGFTTFVYAISVLTNLFVSETYSPRYTTGGRNACARNWTTTSSLAGFGRVGQAVVRGLQEMGKRCIVLDRNPAAEADPRSRRSRGYWRCDESRGPTSSGD